MSNLSQIQDNPEAYARSLLARFNLKRIDNIGSFASLLGLKIREVDSDAFEGALVRAPNKLKGIIAVKRTIREEGRKRFTICHEVGHFILPGHGTSDCICKADEVESWRKSLPEQEIAANRFASELLLPYREVAPLVQKKTATIELAKDISREFRSSLTAASLRCVDVTEEKCAFVCSVNGFIKWYKPNDNFRYHVRVNQKLTDESYAGQLFNDPALNDPNGAVPADAWLQSERLLSDARVWEDSILLPHYNSVITILTIHKQIERTSFI
jgi:hypothetical protein